MLWLLSATKAWGNLLYSNRYQILQPKLFGGHGGFSHLDSSDYQGIQAREGAAPLSWV